MHLVSYIDYKAACNCCTLTAVHILQHDYFLHFADRDQKHVDWVKAWIATLTELQDYVKQFHTTGVSWNPKVSTLLCASRKLSPRE